MNDFKRDIMAGLMFIVGIFGFISGEFIVSTVMFATSALFSNMIFARRLHG